MSSIKFNIFKKNKKPFKHLIFLRQKTCNLTKKILYSIKHKLKKRESLNEIFKKRIDCCFKQFVVVCNRRFGAVRFDAELKFRTVDNIGYYYVYCLLFSD